MPIPWSNIAERDIVRANQFLLPHTSTHNIVKHTSAPRLDIITQPTQPSHSSGEMQNNSRRFNVPRNVQDFMRQTSGTSSACQYFFIKI